MANKPKLQVTDHPERFTWMERRGRNGEGDLIDVMIFVDASDQRVLAEIVIPDEVNDFEARPLMGYPHNEVRFYIKLEAARQYCEAVALSYLNGEDFPSPAILTRRAIRAGRREARKLGVENKQEGGGDA